MKPRAWVVGAAALAIGLGLVLRLLIPAGMDPTIFLAIGEDAVPQASYARERLGDVATRPELGHDGKYFFIQANDPWYLDPGGNAAYLDRPVYRAQRMLFPLLAGGFGWFAPRTIVWAMLVINVLCLGLGGWIAARIASRAGGSPWVGLAVPLNIGLLYELMIGGSGILAYVCCLGAVLMLGTKRSWTAAVLIAAAALSREAMLAFGVGMFAIGWWQGRRFRWQLIVMPVVVLMIWHAYLSARLNGMTGSGATWPIFGPPFIGMFRALKAWLADPSDLLLNLAILVIVLAFSIRAATSRSVIAWGALPFVALATVLSEFVWRQPFDISRALAPVFTAAAFLLWVPERAPAALPGTTDESRSGG